MASRKKKVTKKASRKKKATKKTRGKKAARKKVVRKKIAKRSARGKTDRKKSARPMAEKESASRPQAISDRGTTTDSDLRHPAIAAARSPLHTASGRGDGESLERITGDPDVNRFPLS